MISGPIRTKTPPRVVIVGAGPGGLAAAMLLRHAGCEVTVLERRESVGGRTSSIRAEGFRFDLGPTFFLYPRVLAEVFRTVGRDLYAEVPMARLDPQYRIEFGAGGRVDATADETRMDEQIARLSPGDVGNFRRYMQENREKLRRFRPALESAFSGWGDLTSPDLIKALPILRPWSSVDGDLKRFFSDERLRIAFSFQSKYLGMSPFRCPSLFTILAFLEYEHGVWHPYGGCGQISERMAEIAVEMGVEVRTGEGVESLEFVGRRAVAARTGRKSYPLDSLVINADFARAMERLVPDRLRSRWSDRSLEKKKYSCSTYMMYLGLDGEAPDLPHHTIRIAKNYKENLADIEDRHVLSDDPSIYVQNACVTDPTLAPAGRCGLYVLAPVSHRHPNIDWDSAGPAFRKKVLAKLEEMGVEDVSDRIVYEKVVTPDDWDASYEIYRGATFNLAHNLGQMLHLRPRNRFEDLDGVYLVGGGTHPGSGLPVIYESARITSRLLCGDHGLTFSEPDGPEPAAYASAAPEVEVISA